MLVHTDSSSLTELTSEQKILKAAKILLADGYTYSPLEVSATIAEIDKGKDDQNSVEILFTFSRDGKEVPSIAKWAPTSTDRPDTW